jgi:hypothetical protein
MEGFSGPAPEGEKTAGTVVLFSDGFGQDSFNKNGTIVRIHRRKIGKMEAFFQVVDGGGATLVTSSVSSPIPIPGYSSLTPPVCLVIGLATSGEGVSQVDSRMEIGEFLYGSSTIGAHKGRELPGVDPEFQVAVQIQVPLLPGQGLPPPEKPLRLR